MTEAERKIWHAVRRGLLLIAAAIDRDHDLAPLWGEVRRGLLLIAAAIEEAV